MLRNYIKTVVTQLPSYIEKYPEPHQHYLNQFRDILRVCESGIDKPRYTLFDKLEKYCQNQMDSESYLNFPFLWAAVDYITNANQLLEMADYKAEDFLTYLTKYFTNKEGTKGIFQLIREKTPLKDHRWEELQYSLVKTRTLNKEELQLLNKIYFLLSSIGIQGLNPKRLKKNIIEPTGIFKSNKEIDYFFRRLDARWLIWFSPNAVGLKQFFVDIHFRNGISLEEVIDFKDTRNSILTVSHLFQKRENPDNYLGLLTVPEQQTKEAALYFSKCQNNQTIILNKFEEVIDFKLSSSLALYRAEKGWRKLTDTQCKNLAHKIKKGNPRKKKSENTSFYLTNSMNPNFSYFDYEKPINLVNLYCKASGPYSFNKLPLGYIGSFLTPLETGLLSFLHQRHIIIIGFQMLNLLYEFTMDQHFVIISKHSENLEFLLELLPFSSIYFTEKDIILVTNLPSNLMNWLKKELNWDIFTVIRTHNPQSLNCELFDKKSLNWNPVQQFIE
jgi:hypothetical protein